MLPNSRTRLLPGSGSGITEQFLASVTEISRNAVTGKQKSAVFCLPVNDETQGS